jgi:hypothetical protein
MLNTFTSADFDIFDDSATDIPANSWNPIPIDLKKLSRYINIKMIKVLFDDNYINGINYHYNFRKCK